MGIPDLPEKDLLGVVSCKTTKSHNKVLHFRYEREGTVFFVHKKGSEYIFSMKPDRTAKQVVIKRNTYPNFLYIPVKQIISEEGDVSIYRKGKDYIVKPASEKEIQLKKKKTNTKYTLAQRTNINGIILPKADRSRLYATGALKMHIVSGKEKLKATMTNEQKELFEKYTDCVREHQTNYHYRKILYINRLQQKDRANARSFSCLLGFIVFRFIFHPINRTN